MNNENNSLPISPNWRLTISTGENRIVHAHGCSFINDWDISGCEEIKKFKPGKHNPCPTCARLCYATLGAKDYDKNYKSYQKLLNTISVNLVKRLYSDSRAKTQLIGKKLFLQMKEDNWYIDFSFGVQLFHNNYNMKERESGESWTSIGFHEHELHASSDSDRFAEAIRNICDYDYQIAEEKHKEKRRKRKAHNKEIRKTFNTLDAEYDPEYYGFFC